MTRTILFDLDGTLVHSAPDLHAALNVALHEQGRAPLDLQTVISFIGNGVEMLVKRGLEATGGVSPGVLDDAMQGFLRFYDENLTNLTHPYPGVVQTLERLHQTGVAMGICTNKPTQPARAICDALELTRFFDVIAGAEPDQPKKPDPAPLLNSISALGGTPDTALFVGDSEIDHQTACNAAVPFRLFSAGYLHHPLPALAGTDMFDDWHHSGLT